MPSSPARGIAAQVVANASLLIAVLVYMGWAYDDALYGYFHIRPLDLNVSVVEYMLRSLSLFSTTIVFVAVALIAITTAHARGVGKASFAAAAQRSAIPGFWRVTSNGPGGQSRVTQVLMLGAGVAITVAALVLAWIARHVQVSTYLFLLLLGSGPLLLTWPMRAGHRGRFPYALAIVVAAVCALWAASLYAHSLGIQAAKNVVQGLPDRTAVVLYSIQPLALSGPGVTVDRLPRDYRYHYRYEGLRLLITRAGTYYLLPVGWSPQLDETYVFDQSDEIRIELLGPVTAS